MVLKGSKTEKNLKDAVAREAQINCRYLYFATKADIEGQNDIAALFRSKGAGGTARPSARSTPAGVHERACMSRLA